MPLTPAEKMRRYREKLKNDPIRYEDYKKKDLIRIKLKNKKITELSEKEKADQRKKWRKQKKRQKEKKTESTIKVIEIKKPSTSTEAPTAIKCVNKIIYLRSGNYAERTETAISKNILLRRNIEK
ncbi:hypothetical protein EVAR_12569_1 [Eumeta japonica]|uniref:Uncharacterized protein n=1 Tax=Eumeta variegata TaxID=151549 RepID=A0A4C1UEN4_EUMVA|nr:hypothetical protein EVAR_12569_1 [Eumeta japonica]